MILAENALHIARGKEKIDNTLLTGYGRLLAPVNDK
jgi:hypothetical protein